MVLQRTPLAPIGDRAAQLKPSATPAPLHDLQAAIRNALGGDCGPSLTAPGGRLAEQAQNVRDRLAIFENGIVFALDTHERDHEVRGVMGLARAARVQIGKPLVVDMATIQKLNAGRVQGVQVQTTVDDVRKMERQILDMLTHAIANDATDIHVNIDGPRGSVRYRIDNMVVPVEEQSPAALRRLIRAMFTMAGSKDAQFIESQSQGARIADSERLRLPGGCEAVRLQYAPEAGGASLAIRLLHSRIQEGEEGLRSLGYSEEHIETIDDLTDQQSGAVIIAGRMNSGKSTSCKCSLEWLYAKAKGGRRVMTIEDPVELRIAGAQQTSITDAKSTEERVEKFARQIRDCLRMDVNVLLVGEIRDRAVADAALEVAISGHQLWTTTHTYSAFGIPERLLDFGIEPYKVGNSEHISAFVCQSLVRHVCPECGIPFSDPKAPVKPRLRREIESIGAAGVDLGRVLVGNLEGCQKCRRGFKGRTLAAEFVRTDETIMAHVRDRQIQAARAAWLDRREPTMLEHAFKKALEGRVCPVEAANAVGHGNLEEIRPDVVGASEPKS